MRLLETIGVLLGVLFLKAALEATSTGPIPWSAIIFPIAVLIFAMAIWLIKRAHDH